MHSFAMINQLAAWDRQEFMVRTESFPSSINGSPSNSKKKGKKGENIIYSGYCFFYNAT
jgi:hypothetical protein